MQATQIGRGWKLLFSLTVPMESLSSSQLNMQNYFNSRPGHFGNQCSKHAGHVCCFTSPACLHLLNCTVPPPLLLKMPVSAFTFWWSNIWEIACYGYAKGIPTSVFLRGDVLVSFPCQIGVTNILSLYFKGLWFLMKHCIEYIISLANLYLMRGVRLFLVYRTSPCRWEEWCNREILGTDLGFCVSITLRAISTSLWQGSGAFSEQGKTVGNSSYSSTGLRGSASDRHHVLLLNSVLDRHSLLPSLCHCLK